MADRDIHSERAKPHPGPKTPPPPKQGRHRNARWQPDERHHGAEHGKRQAHAPRHEIPDRQTNEAHEKIDLPSGVARFADHDLSAATDAELTPYRREHVGFVFQFYNLIPSLTVRENVELVTDIAQHPMPADDALARLWRVLAEPPGTGRGLQHGRRF